MICVRKFLICLFCYTSCFAQITGATDIEDQIRTGLDLMYDFRFKEAEAMVVQIEKKLPSHPVVPMLEALIIYWKYPGVLPEPQKTTYRKLNEDCLLKASKLAKDPKYAVEAKYFMLIAHGYLALMADTDREYFKAISQAKHAYDYMKEGLKLTAKNPEFFTTSGLYTYYLIQYPINHPAFRPLMAFFDGGDKKKGLEYLEKAAATALFSKTEAQYYLMNVSLKYENNFALAYKYGSTLNTLYPHNMVYKARFIETCIASNKKEQAEAELAILKTAKGRIYPAMYHYLEGRIQEQFYKNTKQAEQLYAQSIKAPTDAKYNINFQSMAYVQLGSLFKSQGKKKLANDCFKAALESTEYAWVKRTAKAGLN